MSRWMRARSVLDRVVAAVLLAVLWPFIAVLGLAVRISDRGPAFVGVPRMGRNGRVFTMWKLRSMRAENADGRANGVSLTALHDNRITPIGVRLRAYYLDELPQLWNVVRGEMALLGARPEAPEFIDMADPRWQLVLSAPPGIAGPTQLVVNEWERHLISADRDGRTYVEQVVPVKLAIDGWYLRSATPRLDLIVLGTLLRRFIPGTGSHTLKKLVRSKVPETAVITIASAQPGASGRTGPEPTGPEPTGPEPTGPEPTEPDRTIPEPTDPVRAIPQQTDPEPGQGAVPSGLDHGLVALASTSPTARRP